MSDLLFVSPAATGLSVGTSADSDKDKDIRLYLNLAEVVSLFDNSGQPVNYFAERSNQTEAVRIDLHAISQFELF